MTTLDVLDSFLSIHLSPYKLPVSFSLIVFMADFLLSMDIFFTSLIKEEHQNSHTPLLQKKKKIHIAQLDPFPQIICNEETNLWNYS